MTALRRLAVLLAGILLIAGAPTAIAQTAAGQTPARPAPAPAVALTPDQARDVLDTLNDPKKRAEFAATLNAIVKAAPAPAAASQPAAQPAAPGPTAPAAAAGSVPSGNAAAAPAPATAAPTTAADAPAADLPLPLAPDSLGARLLVTASGVLAETSARAEDALEALRGVPTAWGWMVLMINDPWGRAVLQDTLWRLAVVFAIGLLAEYGARRLLRRPRAAVVELGARFQPDDVELTDEEPDPVVGSEGDKIHGARVHLHHWRVTTLGMLRRLPLTLCQLGLDLLPVLAFLLAAHLVLGTRLGGPMHPRLVMIALVGAYATCSAILCAARWMFAPSERGLRLLGISDDTAAYMMRWTRLLAVVTVFGYALGEAGRLLGLSDVARETMFKTVGLVDQTFLAIIVVQKRRAVRAWIRAPDGARGVMAQLRNRMGAAWHWVALFYLAALWLVWAVEIPDGFSAVLHIFVVTTAVLIGMRLAQILLRGTIDRLITPRPETLAKYPGIKARLRMWRPMLHVLVDSGLYLATFLGLLQLWGFGSFGWLTGTDLGRHVLGAATTMLITLVLAMVVWEAANHGVERHLDRLSREAQVARSARLRTLLPMLRSVLMATILVVIGLVILSEIGLNVAPLLAGAGVLGIAIGFGSQKLVQDVITGLFLLLENTVQVGDIVSLAGLSGVVEDLSVRTIRLRAEDGSVHVIPFSAVTTVTNQTRDFGHAVIEVGVAYKEDYDRVIEVMRAVVTEMRREPRWKGEIRDELEVMGLNAFADSAVMIKARIKCGPFGRWSVLREYNRRMKARFDKEGIEIPFPQRTLILNQPLPVAERLAATLPAAPASPPGKPQETGKLQETSKLQEVAAK